VRTSELDYELPSELIAQSPAEPRSSSRLLVHDRPTRAIRHRCFADLLDELDAADLVVVNDTRVLPVRLLGRRATGGAVELLLLEPGPSGAWQALARPYARLRPGEVVSAPGLDVRVDERLGEGRVTVTPLTSEPIERALAGAGEMPLPPYIRQAPADPERYQTVYAREPGSAAAPTAGLHFTPELWDELRTRMEVVAVTLGVGLDTFRPVAEDDLAEHEIHSERYQVSEEAAAAIGAALAAGRRVVAIGTTVVRVLETVFGDPPGPLAGRSRLFITPGHRFQAVGAMVTNFHLPRSTLLALVMAFAGVDETREIYRTAIAERYRFYSFGDACLIR
jgi:S-adenosylmethionine:tRNA ribosyltransferase-isomerase